eukprot:gnl/Trimastix_PCT/2117.p1 GENE.gnl/Trimastix_PCT/2117~~gnl/Trimastix_PCT/2117.p1  ORF type:complete len:632 (-),score=67.90 gnl/Trimastix_PCT/2117:31-1926(-)
MLDEADLQCVICLHLIEDAVETPCCHQVLCKKCVENLDRCPFDRRPLNPNECQPCYPIRRLVSNFPITCPNEGCGYQTTRGELDNHISICGFQLVPCKWSAECNVMRKDLRHHEDAKCPHRIVACPQDCGLQLEHCLVEDHVSRACPATEIACEYCDARMPRAEHAAHIAQCPKAPARCPFAPFGCLHEAPASEMDAHLTDGLQGHLLLLARTLADRDARIERLEHQVSVLSAVLQADQQRMLDQAASARRAASPIPALPASPHVLRDRPALRRESMQEIPRAPGSPMGSARLFSALAASTEPPLLRGASISPAVGPLPPARAAGLPTEGARAHLGFSLVGEPNSPAALISPRPPPRSPSPSPRSGRHSSAPHSRRDDQDAPLQYPHSNAHAAPGGSPIGTAAPGGHARRTDTVEVAVVLPPAARTHSGTGAMADRAQSARPRVAHDSPQPALALESARGTARVSIHWDARGKHEGVTISTDGLTATHSPVDKRNESVRTNVGFSQGTHFWEVRIDRLSSVGFNIGVVKAEFNVAKYLGWSDGASWSFLNSGRVWHNGKAARFSQSYGEGDTIGVLLELERHALSFFKNGEFLGTAFGNLPEDEVFYPAVSFGRANDQATISFSATPPSLA